MTNHVRKTATRMKMTLCTELKKHQFVETVNPNVKVCTRSDCLEVHILTGGHWRFGTRLKSKRQLLEQAEKSGSLALEMKEVPLWDIMEQK